MMKLPFVHPSRVLTISRPAFAVAAYHPMKRTILLYLFLSVALAAHLSATTARGAAGDVYVGEIDSSTILKFTPSGTKSTFAGMPFPEGLAFDRTGNLFAVQTDLGAIFKITPSGTKSTFASGLSNPQGIAFDGAGDLFVAERGNGTISRFTPAGIKSTFASGLIGPAGLAFDNAGNLFAADDDRGDIFKFTPAGIKSTFASGLNSPTGLAFDSAGNLFEADDGSNIIFKFSPGGTKSIFASGLNTLLAWRLTVRAISLRWTLVAAPSSNLPQAEVRVPLLPALARRRISLLNLLQKSFATSAREVSFRPVKTS
jgi:sugar lactone lactonase YvrE